MNIIFEGVDGVGKTTHIKKVIELLNKENCNSNYIKEIEFSPLQEILEGMLKVDPFFKSNKKINTSIYETFILAADFFYKQENFRDFTDGINIYDRDFLTIMCYQKIILEKDYGEEIKDFFENFSKCLLFKLKKINLIIYISVPLETSFERVAVREKKPFSEEQKAFIREAKDCFESFLLPIQKKNNTPILYLNGANNLIENAIKIIEEIKICEN